MNAHTGISIFEYLDYRKFLIDFYGFKKSVNKHFSHRVFARKAGLTSSGYFSEIINGVRNLSKNKVAKFAKGLELEDKERAYFELMVRFNHADSNKAKQSLYEMMVAAMPTQIHQLKRSQLEYFSKWYYVAVRETLAIHAVRDDYAELAEKLHPSITPTQAKSAIRLLHELGLIEKDAEGFWRARHLSLLSKRDESAALLLRAFQGEMIGKAREALETVPEGHRDISNITMSISGEGMERLKVMVADFRKRVQEFVQSDRNEDRVLQLNIQLFPLTRIEDGNAKNQP